MFSNNMSCFCHSFCLKDSWKGDSHATKSEGLLKKEEEKSHILPKSMITVHWSLRSEGVKLLACWKGEHLFLQQQDNLECQDRLLGSGCCCVGSRWLELFLTCLQWAPLRNNSTAGSLCHCSNFSQQQLTTGTTLGLRRISFGPVWNHLHERCLHKTLLFIHTWYGACYFQNDPVLTEVLAPTIHDSHITFDLFQHLNSWIKLLLPKFHHAMKKC